MFIRKKEQHIFIIQFIIDNLHNLQEVLCFNYKKYAII